MKKLFESWRKVISESNNGFLDHYNKLLRKKYAGLVLALVKDSDTAPHPVITTCMVGPELDGFVTTNDEGFVYDGGWYDIEPIPEENLPKEYIQILSDYEIIYPFSMDRTFGMPELRFKYIRYDDKKPHGLKCTFLRRNETTRYLGPAQFIKQRRPKTDEEYYQAFYYVNGRLIHNKDGAPIINTDRMF